MLLDIDKETMIYVYITALNFNTHCRFDILRILERQLKTFQQYYINFTYKTNLYFLWFKVTHIFDEYRILCWDIHIHTLTTYIYDLQCTYHNSQILICRITRILYFDYFHYMIVCIYRLSFRDFYIIREKFIESVWISLHFSEMHHVWHTFYCAIRVFAVSIWL